MSSIFKLSVSGIRAFDNHDRETIQFGKPLTLIAGQNGVGKTTIIEALRYVTTGDLPPNSKGGAFIHDPKMSSEREVLAQVKLAYFNTNGDKMVCTRSMQLTVKKTTQTFKTLEGQLLVSVGDQRETVSSKCADLDIQVPLSLGITPAVLNYVVFCHQEESFWPFAEPSAVKKRFDEIFEATKFTKALDTLKVLRKDYTTDTKVQEKTVQYLKQDNDRAERIKLQVSDLSNKVIQYREECTALKASMEDTVKALNKSFEQNQKFQEVVYQLKQTRQSHETLKADLANTLNNLEVMDGHSLADLEKELGEFDQTGSNLDQEVVSLNSEAEAKKADLSAQRTTISNIMLRKGTLEAEKESFHKQEQALRDINKRACSEFGLEALDPQNTAGVTQCLEKHAATLRDEFEHLKCTTEERCNTIDQNIAAKTSEKIQMEQKFNSLQESIRKSEREMTKLAANNKASENKVRDLKYHASKLNDVREALAKATAALADFKASTDPEALEQDLIIKKAKYESITKEFAQATESFGNQSRAMALEDSVKKKRFRLEELGDAVGPIFGSVVGKPLVPTSAKEDYTTARQALESRKHECSAETNALFLKKQGLLSRQEIAHNELAKLETKTSELKERIEATLGNDHNVDEFEETLAELDEDLEVATQNMEQSSFATKYYEAANSLAKQNHECLLCRHKFTSSEQDLFLELLTEKIAAIPLSLEESEAALESARKQQESLRALVPSYSQYRRIVDEEMTSVKEQLENLQKEQGDLERCLEKSRTTMNGIEEKLTSFNELNDSVYDIARTCSELREIEQELAQLKPSSSVEKAMDPQTLRKRLSEASADLSSAETAFSDFKDQIQALKNSVSSLESTVATEEAQLKVRELEDQNRKNEAQKISELRVEIEEQKNAVSEHSTHLQPLVEALDSLKEDLRKTKIECAKEEKALSEKRSSVLEVINKRASLITDLEALASKVDADSLRKLNDELGQAEAGSQSIQRDIESFESKRRQLESRVANSRGQRRTIEDNIRLHKLRGELQASEELMQSLEGQSPERDKEKYEQETNELQASLSSLTSDHSRKLGEIKQMEQQKAQLESELAKDYQKVSQEYKKESVKLDITSTAIEDLTKYSKVLDTAIITYHTTKMKEINGILDELWKRTYTGTDIDTILIKSESEGKGTRFMYNYRVCMVKNDTELDMRGRCSAGQKVLASVIIRLALSECFGVNSGLIVLDEPTTNLDHSNIESLAQSLSNIIELRQSQRNFQLIVITHDEHFLTAMGASRFCEYFYRVCRDSRQMSKIERVPMTHLID